MHFYKPFFTALFLALSANSAYAYQQYQPPSLPGNNIDYNNIDKNAKDWIFTLNGEELEYLPGIYIEGNVKYFPIDIVKSLGAEFIFNRSTRTAYITNNDESFMVKEGEKQIYLNNKSFIIHDPPIWKNDTLYIPKDFLLRFNTLISENKYKNVFNIIKVFNAINQVTTISDSTENKLVFHLNAIPVYKTEVLEDSFKLSFFGTVAKDENKLKEDLSSLSSYFKDVKVFSNEKGVLNIIFQTKGDIGAVNTFHLEKPERLVIQFPKYFRTGNREIVKEGLYHGKLYESDFQGPTKSNTLEINPRLYNIQPVVSRDSESEFSLREVSQFAKDYNAVAATNGGYFSGGTRFPLGLLIINKKLVSAPIYNRSALLIKDNGNFEIKNVDLNIYIKTYDLEGISKLTKINAYNLPPQKNQMVLFSYNYGKKHLNINKESDKKEAAETEKEFDGYIVSAKDMRISKIDDFSLAIPPGSYALYASGTAKAKLRELIESNRYFELVFEYSQPISDVKYAIGGGPTLIKNGEIEISAELERFQKDITDGRAPRTAFGVMENNKAFLLTVDGRQADSRGVSLEELAAYLKRFNIHSAINFDGGGSTAMYLNGKIVSQFSDPKERKVSNAILIFPEKKQLNLSNIQTESAN